MGAPEPFTSKGDKEITNEMARTVHDNGSTPTGTVLPLEYGWQRIMKI